MVGFCFFCVWLCTRCRTHTLQGTAPPPVASGKAKKRFRRALLADTLQLLRARVLAPHTEFPSFCIFESVFLLFCFFSLSLPHMHACLHSRTPALTHACTHARTQACLPSAHGLISIPLKDQESTRPGKCYPDKQNCKYLHPQG